MQAENVLLRRRPRRVVREPMDERLPDGRRVAEAVADYGAPSRGTMYARPPVAETEPPSLDTNRSRVMAAIRDSLSRPEETPTTPTPRVHAGRGGLSGVDPSLLEQGVVVGAKARAENATPKTMNRWKAAALGALQGMAQGGIGGAIGGAGLGLVSPNAIQGMRDQRQEAIRRQREEQGLESESKRADLEYKKAQTEAIKNPAPKVFEPDLRTDAEGNLISVSGTTASPVLDKAGKPVKAKVSEDGATVEIEVSGRKLNVTPAQALTYFGQVGAREEKQTAEQIEKRTKREAAQAEYDQLVSDERTAGEEKNRAYAYLEQLKKNPSVAKEDIAQAAEEAQKVNALYQSFAEKKRDAQRRIRENAVESPTKPLSSKPRWSASRWAAANKGGDVSAAKRAAVAAGYEVVE